MFRRLPPALLRTMGERMGWFTSRTMTVRLDISTMHLNANELDGGWTLTPEIQNADVLFDAITTKSGEEAVLEVGEKSFPLAPQQGDGAKLFELKEACANMHPNRRVWKRR